MTDISLPKAGRGFAIGYVRQGNRARHIPILETWNGKRWQRLDLPWRQSVSGSTRKAWRPAARRLPVRGLGQVNDSRRICQRLVRVIR